MSPRASSSSAGHPAPARPSSSIGPQPGPPSVLRNLEGTLTRGTLTRSLTRSISLAPYDSVTPYNSLTRHSSTAPISGRPRSVAAEEEADPHFLFLLPRLCALFATSLLNAVGVVIALLVGIEVLSAEGTYGAAAAALRQTIPGLHLGFVDILAATVTLAGLQFLGLLVAIAVATLVFAHMPRRESRVVFRVRLTTFISLALLQLGAVIIETIFVSTRSVRATGVVSQNIADSFLRSRGVHLSYGRVPLILAFTLLSWAAWLSWLFCSLLVIRASSLAHAATQPDPEKGSISEKTPTSFLGFCFGTSDSSEHRKSQKAKRKEENITQALESLGVIAPASKSKSKGHGNIFSRFFSMGSVSNQATKGTSSSSKGTVEILSSNLSPVEARTPDFRELTRRAMGPGTPAAESLRRPSFEPSVGRGGDSPASTRSQLRSDSAASSEDDLAITPATTTASSSVAAITVPVPMPSHPEAARRGLSPLVLPSMPAGMPTEVELRPSPHPSENGHSAKLSTPGGPDPHSPVYDPRSPGYESYGSREQELAPYETFDEELEISDAPPVSEPIHVAPLVEAEQLPGLVRRRARSIEAWQKALAATPSPSSSPGQGDLAAASPQPLPESTPPPPSPFQQSPLPDVHPLPVQPSQGPAEARSSFESLRSHTPSVLHSIAEEPEPDEDEIRRRDTSSSNNRSTLSQPSSVEVLRTPSDAAPVSFRDSGQGPQRQL